MTRKGSNGKYLKKTSEADVYADAFDLYQMTHKEVIDMMRANHQKTWIKERHLKKYIWDRQEIDNAESQMMRNI